MTEEEHILSIVKEMLNKATVLRKAVCPHDDEDRDIDYLFTALYELEERYK